MSDTRESRIIIAEMFADVLKYYFGPAAITKPAWMVAFEATRTDITFGSFAQSFREVRRGLWQPGEVKDNRVTVVDAGQRREDGEEFRDGGFDVLAIQLIFDLKANFTREGALDAFIPIIQSVARYMHMVTGTDANILAIDYVRDTPFEVAVGEAGSAMHWVVEFEIEYCEFAPP